MAVLLRVWVACLSALLLTADGKPTHGRHSSFSNVSVTDIDSEESVQSNEELNFEMSKWKIASGATGSGTSGSDDWRSPTEALKGNVARPLVPTESHRNAAIDTSGSDDWRAPVEARAHSLKASLYKASGFDNWRSSVESRGAVASRTSGSDKSAPMEPRRVAASGTSGSDDWRSPVEARYRRAAYNGTSGSDDWRAPIEA